MVLCVQVGTRKWNLPLAKIKKKSTHGEQRRITCICDLSGLQFWGNKIQAILKMCFEFYKTISVFIPQIAWGLFSTSIVCQEWGLPLQRSSCPVEKGLGMVSAMGSAGGRVGEVGGWRFRELCVCGGWYFVQKLWVLYWPKKTVTRPEVSFCPAQMVARGWAFESVAWKACLCQQQQCPNNKNDYGVIRNPEAFSKGWTTYTDGRFSARAEGKNMQ